MEKTELRQNRVLSQFHQWGNLPILWSNLCLWGDNWRYTCGSFSLPVCSDFLRAVHKFKKYVWQNVTLTWKYKYSTWVTEYLIILSVQLKKKKKIKRAYHFPSSFSYCWTVYPNISSRGPLKVSAFFTSTFEVQTRWKKALKKKVF